MLLDAQKTYFKQQLCLAEKCLQRKLLKTESVDSYKIE